MRLLFLLLISCSAFLPLTAQETRTFIFGHSLLDHRPPAIPTPSNETTIPHWVYLLAKEAGTDYAAGGQYGFLPQHRRVPPIAQWGYDSVPGVWESDTEPFSAADITEVIITAGNFMQWQGPDEEYPGDPGITPISATEDILDWVGEQEEDVRYYLYENWPDMAGYLNNGFPPSGDEFANYNAYTLGDFHDWWLEYQDALLVSRPEVQVRMIPVGPILARLFSGVLPTAIPLTELYEDDAPHGRASLYFLAALATYMGTFSEPAPASYEVPEIVHPVIRDNYATIVTFMWEELLAFNDDDGNSRVFFSRPNSANDYAFDVAPFTVFPNPTRAGVTLEGPAGAFTLLLTDALGRKLQEAPLQGERPFLSLAEHPAGWYFLQLRENSGKIVQVLRVRKH